MRLDRFLSEESDYTRSQIKKLIRQGQVQVNGDSKVTPDRKVDPEKDRIQIQGRSVRATGMVCLLINKPQGVVSATEDRRARTVLDLIDQPYAGKLFPVGRLDKDTEGLLLLTNDGDLAHCLLSPRKHVYKVYFALVEGEVVREDEDAFLQGLEIGEKAPTLPAVMRRLSVDGDFLWRMESRAEKSLPCPDRQRPETGAVKAAASAGSSLTDARGRGREIGLAGSRIGDEETLRLLPGRMKEICLHSLTLGDYARGGPGQSICAVAVREGKFHQIKRMYEAVGKKVVYLKRIAMGPLILDGGMETGSYRRLTQEEIAALRARP